jgi:phosphoglucosamine mutase
MMTRYPQVLLNVRGDKDRAMANPELAAAVSSARSVLGESGRVLLRPSGTEPVIRVMVETRQLEVAERVAGELAAAVRTAMS